MATSYKRFEVGSKVFHEDYGEGMVVEVRPRPFFDVLEVAFSDGVRRLNSNHPKISDQPPRSKPPRRKPNLRLVKPSKSRQGKAQAAPEETADETETLEDESPSEGPRFAFQDDILCLDSASVESLLELPPPQDQGDGFARLLVAERLGLTRGFQNLLALSAVQDLEQYEFQIQAVRRVLREMRGRAILADEVGLGKTIEAGLILKEYALRGLIRSALILTPVSLMSQWREELRRKFEIPVEIYARGERWDTHPWLIASIDTAKTEKHREEIAEADYDLVIVDEAHRLRNHLTQGWKFIDALGPKYLLLLTATPVQNDLRELYNLVTLVRPGQLGTYREFRKRFMQRGNKRLLKDARSLAEMLSTTMVRTSRAQLDRLPQGKCGSRSSRDVPVRAATLATGSPPSFATPWRAWS
ncbi:MAG: DEAD/DEAH box helicase [Candidatus Eisenbacteria bacterium]